MKLALLSDVHGNLEALDAVLADVAASGVTAIACLGDFVGYGASPNECVARLRGVVDVAVLGNHDAAALGRLTLGRFHSDAATTARWTDQHLTAECRDWLGSLPMSVAWHGHRIVHATPTEPEEWHYVLSIEDARYEFAGFAERVCFIGHSHSPGVFGTDGGMVSYARAARVAFEPGRRYIVNVGSVGQPRDGDPRAAWLAYDEEHDTVEHRRVEYDVERASARIKDAGLPAFLAERIKWGE